VAEPVGFRAGGACDALGGRHGHEPVIVFDGRAPEGAIGTGCESADDWLAREAARLAESGEPFWFVTSDRELRDRAGTQADKVIGGGSFVRELTGFRV